MAAGCTVTGSTRRSRGRIIDAVGEALAQGSTNHAVEASSTC